MAAGGEAKGPPDDVLYQDENICILKPDSPRGVIVFHKGPTDRICSEGLLSYNEFRRRNPNLGLRKTIPTGNHNLDHDDLIYFRAPFTADGSSFEASFGTSPEELLHPSIGETIVLLKVDPFKTNVFFSEARVHRFQNRNLPYNFHYYTKPLWQYMRSKVGRSAFYGTPLWEATSWGAPERYWEVVVKRNHIPKEWFVDCIYNGLPVKSQWKDMDPRNKPFVEIENTKKKESLLYYLRELGTTIEGQHPELDIEVKQHPVENHIINFTVEKKPPEGEESSYYLYGHHTFRINAIFYTLEDKEIPSSYLKPDKDIPKDIYQSIIHQILDTLKERRRAMVDGPPKYPVVVSKALRNRIGLVAKGPEAKEGGGRRRRTKKSKRSKRRSRKC
jgi:hypothetical protein